MRTNVDIDDGLMAEAMRAGPFKTKKEAVEAGLKLLARQAAHREILRWEGRLKWEGDESIDWTAPASATGLAVQEPGAVDRNATLPMLSAAVPSATPAPAAAPKRRRAGR